MIMVHDGDVDDDDDDDGDEWCIRFPSAQMVWFFEAHYVHEMSPTLH